MYEEIICCYLKSNLIGHPIFCLVIDKGWAAEGDSTISVKSERPLWVWAKRLLSAFKARGKQSKNSALLKAGLAGKVLQGPDP